MSGGKDATSEQSSLVREGTGYDKVYKLGREPEEDLSCSSTREPSAHSHVEGGKGLR